MNKTLDPEQVTAIVDTREQDPLDLAPLKVTKATLATGDYSVVGLEHYIAIERKSLIDLIGCIGRDRDRFEKEIMRLLAYPVRALVIESDWGEIEMKRYRGIIHPNAVMGSLMGWIAMGIPVVFMGDHARAGKWVARMLYIAARRRYLEALPLINSLAS